MRLDAACAAKRVISGATGKQRDDLQEAIHAVLQLSFGSARDDYAINASSDDFGFRRGEEARRQVRAEMSKTYSRVSGDRIPGAFLRNDSRT
jgi:hypothetical protein